MLQDVITEFGANPLERRSVGENLNCYYYPKENKPQSKGCAIGMYLSDEVAKKIDSIGCISIVSLFYIDEYNLLPKWMRKMDLLFLSDIQELHDNKIFWGDNEISELGIKHIKTICKTYNLNFDELIFPKYLDLSK